MMRAKVREASGSPKTCGIKDLKVGDYFSYVACGVTYYYQKVENPYGNSIYIDQYCVCLSTGLVTFFSADCNTLVKIKGDLIITPGESK